MKPATSDQHEIRYVPADEVLKARIQNDWVSNAGDFIRLDENSFSQVALVAGVPIGVISASKQPIDEPLCALCEVFIDILEVNDEYRGNGIGTELVEKAIAWAEQEGVSQIRTWSMKTRFEALLLLHKLGFAFARVDSPQQLEAPYGFYATKRLSARPAIGVNRR